MDASKPEDNHETGPLARRKPRIYPTREKMIATIGGERIEITGKPDAKGRRTIVVDLPADAVVTYEKL